MPEPGTEKPDLKTLRKSESQCPTKVSAPLIKECYAHFECKLAGGSLISKYGFFIWEVVNAHVAVTPKYPESLHYQGEGVFMVSGCSISLRKQFKSQNP